MAQAVFVQAGDAIDHTPTSDVAAGDVVVQGDLIGIAKQEIKAGERGALAVVGVFRLSKASGSAINSGAKVYWDDTNDQATTTATGHKLLGKAIATAASADTEVLVRLSQ